MKERHHIRKAYDKVMDLNQRVYDFGKQHNFEQWSLPAFSLVSQVAVGALGIAFALTGADTAAIIAGAAEVPLTGITVASARSTRRSLQTSGATGRTQGRLAT